MCDLDTSETTSETDTEEPDDPLERELMEWIGVWRAHAGPATVVLENGHSKDTAEAAAAAAGLLAELAIAVGLQHSWIELPPSVKRDAFLSTVVVAEPSRRWELYGKGGVFWVDGLGMLLIDKTDQATRAAALLTIASLHSSTGASPLVAGKEVHLDVDGLEALISRWVCDHRRGQCRCCWWFQPWAVWVGEHTKLVLNPWWEHASASEARDALVNLAALCIFVGLREDWLQGSESEPAHSGLDTRALPEGVWELKEDGGAIHLESLGTAYTHEADKTARGRLLSVPLCVLSALDAPDLVRGEPMYLDDPGAQHADELWRQWLLDGLLRSRPVGEA